MAIVHARVDERLIHGQVALVWTNVVGATRIAVVNDEAVKDEMLISALKLSKPAGIKLSILSKIKASEKIKDGAYDGEKLFLITKNIDDMFFLIESGVKIDNVNIGNIAKRDGSISIKRSVDVTEDDINKIKKLIENGVKVTAQMLPNETDESITKYFPN